MPRSRAALGSHSVPQLTPPRPPRVQARTARASLPRSVVSRSRSSTAVSTAAIATPDSTSRDEVMRPPVRAVAYTSTSAPRAPRKAATDREAGPKRANPNTITETAPSEAPEETPSRYGSASGLRTRACRAVPITARPAPVTAPSSTRGARTSSTMVSRARDQSGSCQSAPSACVTMPHTWPGGTCTEPIASPAVAEAASRAVSTSSVTPSRVRPCPGPVDSRRRNAPSAGVPVAVWVTGSSPGAGRGPGRRPRRPSGCRPGWRSAAGRRTACS